MSMWQATAVASSNIALIKYWGNRDQALRLPANASLSMNLAGLTTITSVKFDAALKRDQLILSGREIHGPGYQRVVGVLDRVRALHGDLPVPALVESRNAFPAGAGLASSASGFAALAVAASAAADLSLNEAALSRLARAGSGSACRSVPGGFVEWALGEDDRSSYAYSIAPADHWAVRDVIALIDTGHKAVGSTEGHALAATSPLQAARIASVPDRLAQVRRAILDRNFTALADVVELDSNMMHAVMLTSTPPLMYWQPLTLALLQAVQRWRAQGLPCCTTVDAGPNVHVLCPAEFAAEVEGRLRAFQGVQQVLVAAPGGPAHVIAR